MSRAHAVFVSVIAGACVVGACGLDVVGQLGQPGGSSGAGEGGADSTSGGPSSSGGPAGDGGLDAPLEDPFAVPAPPLDAKAACGRPSVFVDDFADGVLSSNFTATSGPVTEQSGNLVLSYAGAAITSYAARAMVNLEDDRLRVALPVAPPSTARVVVSLRFDDANTLAFVLSGGTLLARSVEGGAVSTSSVPYDPVARRWWQIAEAGGTTRWETSPDGVTWTTIVSRPTPAFAKTVRPILSAADDSGAGPAGQVRFARLNAGRPPTDWCKLSSFSDDFGDGQISRSWEPFQSGACSGGEAGGELRFSIGAATGQCGWRSTAAYDLTASAAYLEVPNISNYHPQVSFSLRVVDVASSGAAEIGFVGSNSLAENASGLAPMTTPYGGSNEDWWRLREAAGMLYWESSSNGTTWVEKRKAPAPFPLTAVKVVISGEASATMPSSISIGTPRFNVGP